jgi:hypothetical protein
LSSKARSVRAQGAEAAAVLLPQPHLRGRERSLLADVLRDVRLDLPAGVVLPGHPGLLAASGGAAHPAIRELGGVFGVAVLAAIFAHYGGYRTPDSFSNGMNAAVYVGAALVAVGALASFLIPRRKAAAQTKEPEARLEAA